MIIMKKLIPIALGVLLLAFSGYGEGPSAKIGFSAGYMFDSEEAFLGAHWATPLTVHESSTHYLELEVGYMRQDDAVGFARARLWIVPVLLNYKVVTETGENTFLYFGAGAGGSTLSLSGSAPGVSISDSDWVLTGQLKAGLEYRSSDALSLLIGARYIYLSRATLFNTTLSNLDDFGIEAGISFSF